jgi:hypothetical protein
MPKVPPVAGLFFSGRPFLLVTFLWASKEKSLGRGSGRRPALSRKRQERWIARFARPFGIVLRTPCALLACQLSRE